jgi:hypothetical protein
VRICRRTFNLFPVHRERSTLKSIHSVINNIRFVFVGHRIAIIMERFMILLGKTPMITLMQNLYYVSYYKLYKMYCCVKTRTFMHKNYDHVRKYMDIHKIKA